MLPRRNWQPTEPFFIRFAPIIGAVLALFTLAVLVSQAIIYYRQSEIMNSQAGVSKEANGLTKEIQRAFITVSNLREEARQDQMGKAVWRYTPEIENSGTTPTTNLQMITINPHSDVMIQLKLRAREIDKYKNAGTEIPKDLDARLRDTYTAVGPIDPEDLFSWPPSDMSPLSIIEKGIIPLTPVGKAAAAPDSLNGQQATLYPNRRRRTAANCPALHGPTADRC